MKLIHVNEASYFYNTKTLQRIDKYDPFDPNIDFIHTVDGIQLYVPHSSIQVGKPLGIFFVYNEEVYAINDWYQEELTFSGYIVNKDFDQRMEYNHEKGKRTRQNLTTFMSKYLERFVAEYNNESLIKMIGFERLGSNNFAINFSYTTGVDDIYDGVIEFKTISNIVNQNKFRKEYGLPYYPYLKNMDKYNCYHFNIFIKNKGTQVNKSDTMFYIIINSIIDYLRQYQSKYMFDFHISMLPVKGNIIRWNMVQ